MAKSAEIGTQRDCLEEWFCFASTWFLYRLFIASKLISSQRTIFIFDGVTVKTSNSFVCDISWFCGNGEHVWRDVNLVPRVFEGGRERTLGTRLMWCHVVLTWNGEKTLAKKVVSNRIPHEGTETEAYRALVGMLISLKLFLVVVIERKSNSSDVCRF